MNADERLEKAAERFADNVAHIIADQVHRSVALERDRVDAGLAELRDEIAAVASQLRPAYSVTTSPPGIVTVSTSDELALLNDRMTRLTETVAALMADNADHSRKAGDQ